MGRKLPSFTSLVTPIANFPSTHIHFRILLPLRCAIKKILRFRCAAFQRELYSEHPRMPRVSSARVRVPAGGPKNYPASLKGATMAPASTIFQSSFVVMWLATVFICMRSLNWHILYCICIFKFLHFKIFYTIIIETRKRNIFSHSKIIKYYKSILLHYYTTSKD